MNKLRFGICGLGFIGRCHFARLRGHQRAELVAVCDRNAGRRRGEWDDELGNLDLGQGTAGRVSMAGIRAYASTSELIQDPELDVVLIALPTPLHAEVAIAALAAGKHVLCEKPMAFRAGQCNDMIAAAEASGRTLMVAQCIRFWPQYELIKRYVDEGRIGTVRFATLRRRASAPTYSADNWLLDGQRSGGAILDLHLHDVDFAQYLLGVPDTIFARGGRDARGAIDHVVATYGYADGRYVLIEGGWALHTPWPFDMAITVHGERGTLDWCSTRGDDVLLYAGGVQPKRIPTSGDALQQQLDYFISCALAGREVERCLPRSTRASVALAWLERRSVETGRVVPLSDRLRAAWSAI